MIDKRLSQMRVSDKAILFSKHAEIRKYGNRHKAYALKKIAESLYEMSDYARASYYASEALLINFSVKWAIFASYLTVRRVIGCPGNPGVD